MTDPMPAPAPAQAAPPPPGVSTSEATYAAIQRVFTAASVIRVNAVMNAAFYACALILVVASTLEDLQHRPLRDPAPFLVGLGNCIVLGLANAAAFYGAGQMSKLRQRPWAIVAVLSMMLPCTSPCFCVTLPVGIWALIALRRVPYDEWA